MIKRSLVIIVFACIAFTACNKKFEMHDNPLTPVDSLPAKPKLVKRFINHYYDSMYNRDGSSYIYEDIDTCVFAYDNMNRLINFTNFWHDSAYPITDTDTRNYKFIYEGSSNQPSSYMVTSSTNKILHVVSYLNNIPILDSAVSAMNAPLYTDITHINFSNNIAIYNNYYIRYHYIDSIVYDNNHNVTHYSFGNINNGEYEHSYSYSNTFSGMDYLNPLFNTNLGNIEAWLFASKHLPQTQTWPVGSSPIIYQYFTDSTGSINKVIGVRYGTVYSKTTYEYY